jgi:hypothetical protein
MNNLASEKRKVMLDRELGWLQLGKLKVKGCNRCQWIAPYQLEHKHEIDPDDLRRIIKAAFTVHQCGTPSVHVHHRQ